VEVKPVRTPDELNAFIRLPWSIYHGDPNWVPPLIRDMKGAFDPEHHPFHEHSEVQSFLAIEDGRPVGRITAIHNRRHQEFHDEPVGFFGFFECINDEHVSEALFDAAGSWLRDRDLKVMRGPTSFSTNETTGFLVGGREGPPMVMMPYNPIYYLELAERYGFKPAKDMVAYWLNIPETPEFLLRGERIVAKRTGATVRRIRMDRFEEELAIVRRIYNSAWEKNWGFVPMTDAEIDFMAAELKPIVDPDLVLFVEDPDGQPIGFTLVLPDFNQVLLRMNGRLTPLAIAKALWYKRKIRHLRVIALGVVQAYRGKGIDGLLYLGVIRNAAKKGINSGEQSWVLDDNVKMRAAIEKMGGDVYRWYRVYDVAL
jgi:GNAT superfamily N-acetyltransferase